MVTILGQRISIVRPSLPYQTKVYKDELPTPKYNRRSKTIKEHTGKVVSICVKTGDGKIWSIDKGAHIHIVEKFGLNPNHIVATGWRLENGNFLWN